MKRFAFGTLCALVTSVAVAVGAPPTLEIPAELIPVNGYVRIAPKTDAINIVYISFDGANPFPSEELKDPRRFLLPVAGLKPGKYRFAAVGTKGDEQTRVDFVVTIPGEDVDPAPGPKPKPDPKPQPTPVPAGKRFVVIVEETGSAVPARGIMLADTALAARMQSQGHKWRVVDKDGKTSAGTTPTDTTPYIKDAMTHQLPWLYIVAPDGTVVYSGAAPNGNDSPKVVLKLLTDSGG